MQKKKYYNDIDLKNWRDYGHIKTDSLWVIDKGGMIDKKFYGAFVPEVGRQLVERYSKAGDTVLDLFVGSGTTASVCKELGRKCIGVDLSGERVDSLREDYADMDFICFDSSDNKLESVIKQINKDFVDLVIMHPPYWDIITFSDDPKDLSNAKSIDKFKDMMAGVIENAYNLLRPGHFAAIVIGNSYKNSEVVPLNFICYQLMKDKGFLWKSDIAKNMSGNEKAKGKNANLWRYRALYGGFSVFGHEYILIFQKEK